MATTNNAPSFPVQRYESSAVNACSVATRFSTRLQIPYLLSSSQNQQILFQTRNQPSERIFDGDPEAAEAVVLFPKITMNFSEKNTLQSVLECIDNAQCKLQYNVHDTTIILIIIIVTVCKLH